MIFHLEVNLGNENTRLGTRGLLLGKPKLHVFESLGVDFIHEVELRQGVEGLYFQPLVNLIAFSKHLLKMENHLLVLLLREGKSGEDIVHLPTFIPVQATSFQEALKKLFRLGILLEFHMLRGFRELIEHLLAHRRNASCRLIRSTFFVLGLGVRSLRRHDHNTGHECGQSHQRSQD